VLGALCVLFAWVFASGIAHAGARYFYCNAMSELLAAPCCPTASSEARASAATEAPTVTAPECCHAEALPALPQATSSAAPAVHAAPLLATSPSPKQDTLQRLLPPRLRAVVIASSAPPLLASERRARLMVFLT
jgi:hypothetical protein